MNKMPHPVIAAGWGILVIRISENHDDNRAGNRRLQAVFRDVLSTMIFEIRMSLHFVFVCGKNIKVAKINENKMIGG